MNQDSANPDGQTPAQPPASVDPSQTVPLMPLQPFAMPPQMPGYPMPGHPMTYTPGWAPPGFHPYMQASGMPLPPGWPPGYPPPQMHGYPAPYPGMPAGYPGMPAYPLPPVTPAASPAVLVVQAAEPPLAVPASAAASPPAAPAASPEPVKIVSTKEPVQAVMVEEPGMTPILRLNPSASSQPTRGPNALVSLWRKVGAGSLMLSLVIHGALLALAGLLAVTVTLQDSPVDFLPGGGTQQGAKASAALSDQVQIKNRRKLNKATPMARLVTTSTSSNIRLPEAPPDILDVPDVSAALSGGGKLGSGGYGFGGAGGGFGNGMGQGAMSGITFKPLMMFGVELKDTRKIAVVMDVSRSMTKFLPIVVKELDKVARGSVVVMYFGCGLAKPPRRKSDVDDKVRKAEGDDFASFWQNWEGDTPVNLPMEDRKKLRYDPAKPMPLDPIYQMMSKRASTYYLDFSGIGYAWTALMSNEVKEADAVYWFADFQDKVDEEQMDAVRRRFKARKQKLFIHASTRGRFFEQVRDNLVLPLDGEVVEVDLPKK